MSTRADVANDSKLVDHKYSSWCIFMGRQFPECYCVNISSNKTRKMLVFCAGEYTSCVIYRQKTENIDAAIP
jgi:hypothetical protein